MDVASRRMAAQGLVDSELTTVEAVVGRILAVQAQDPRGARLAIRPRLAVASEASARASDVDRALDEGSVVVNWLNRGTLHLVVAEDHALLHALTAPRHLTSNQTRLRQEGVSERQAERGVELIRKRLADGPATRAEIKAVLESADVPVARQALIHILFFASLQGLVLRGPTIEGEQAFVLVEDWLGRPDEIDVELAPAELARRYLAGHGPASDRDLAKWAGITLGQARSGLKAIGSELEESDGLVDLKSRPGGGDRRPGESPVRLLGAFDPILHGWGSRDWIVPADERDVVTTNGIFRPTILAGDRVVGTWSRKDRNVKLAPLSVLDPETVTALDREAARVTDYLGL